MHMRKTIMLTAVCVSLLFSRRRPYGLGPTVES